ncbi:Vgb family protein [Agromyces larvae]|uniref:YncE family protein n=1 Tax=Agromyces larvae TaxID=2929802 RepID=A0ABY4BVR7_9MICO|nr:YncE family protein [Agromyces larvae]UOE43264.1 YncE family protein [Agromyces larvae]
MPLCIGAQWGDVMPLGRRIAAALATATMVGAALLLPSPAFAESSTVTVGDFPRPVAISSDGTRGYAAIAVAGGGPGRLVEFDTATDQVLRETAIQNEPLSLVFSPDETRAYVTGEVSGLIDVIDLESLTTVATWTVPPVAPGDNGRAQFLAVGPDGALYASVRNQARVVRLDPVSGEVEVSFNTGSLPAGIAVGGGYLYVAVSVGQTVSRFDLAAPTTVSTIDVPTAPATYYLALSPDGSQLWVSGYTSTIVARVDTADFTTRFTVNLGARVAGGVVAADGARIYVPLENANAVAVLDTADGSELGRVAVGADPRFIAFVPGTQWAWVSNVLGASLSLIGPPIPQAPTDVAAVEGEPVSFSAAARATADGFRWQRSDDGGATWVDVPGGTDATLSFVATLADDGALFRFVASTELFGSAESESALLTVSPAPVPPAPCPGAQACPLPATGVDVAPLAAAVGGMLLAGGLLIAATRRRGIRSRARR